MAITLTQPKSFQIQQKANKEQFQPLKQSSPQAAPLKADQLSFSGNKCQCDCKKEGFWNEDALASAFIGSAILGLAMATIGGIGATVDRIQNPPPPKPSQELLAELETAGKQEGLAETERLFINTPINATAEEIVEQGTKACQQFLPNTTSFSVDSEERANREPKLSISGQRDENKDPSFSIRGNCLEPDLYGEKADMIEILGEASSVLSNPQEEGEPTSFTLPFGLINEQTVLSQGQSTCDADEIFVPSTIFPADVREATRLISPLSENGNVPYGGIYNQNDPQNEMEISGSCKTRTPQLTQQ